MHGLQEIKKLNDDAARAVNARCTQVDLGERLKANRSRKADKAARAAAGK